MTKTLSLIFSLFIFNYVFSQSADSLYKKLNLSDQKLSFSAFKYAYKGYQNLLNSKKIPKKDTFAICDFSQSSDDRRLYIIDLLNQTVLYWTYVAHGKRSGKEFAKSFSNRINSHKSSLGFYLTKDTYYGKNGLSLKIKGLEKGFNSNAEKRGIVIHGSFYVGENYLEDNEYLGRSWGCLAVPLEESEEIIDVLKKGSCIFVYYPSKLYLSNSKIINQKNIHETK